MSTDKQTWQSAQEHEAGYWGTCNGAVAWEEFVKHEMVARELGLFSDYGTPDMELNMQGKTVLDIGGGPVSITLRCFNADRLTVADPCHWPPVVMRRYALHGIQFLRVAGEDLDDKFLSDDTVFDEVWMYNLLQHVQDPAKIVENAVKRVSPTGCLRIFDWCYIPADKCHPHVLTPEAILNWLSGCRIVKVGMPRLREFKCDATAFTGIFAPCR